MSNKEGTVIALGIAFGAAYEGALKKKNLVDKKREHHFEWRSLFFPFK